jgi:riboflavin kinase/FMN adenylyltransferase
MRILNEVVMLAAGIKATSAVVTFDPHPMSVLQPDEAPCLLTSVKEKISQIRRTGVNRLVLMGFNSKLATQSAEWFVKRVLIGNLNMRRLVIGYDFHFGKDREGDASFLESLGEAMGFGVDIVPPVSYLDHPVSSTRVRTALLRGDVKSAACMLGRPYSVSGRVIRGEGRGKTLRYPTANLGIDDAQKMLPANGVYAAMARLGHHDYSAAIYIGERPTFGGVGRVVEVFVLGLKRRLYGRRLEVRFVERLRGDRRFRDERELGEAIGRDVARAKRILSI